MPSAARSAVAPLYLLSSLILGGSAQGIWQNMVLQLVGLGIILWAATAPADEPLSPEAKRIFPLALAGIVIVIIQLVPLPPAFWTHGVRAKVADGYNLLGQPVPALPISLTPYDSLGTLLCLIPPIAMFCALTRLKAYRQSWLAAALIAGAVAGIMLGALQVASSAEDSPLYLYKETSHGAGVGFFANANHMADLLVITLPFLAALAAAGRSRNIQRFSALLTVLAAAALVLVVGIVLNESLAGYSLLLPVLAASALIVLPSASRLRGAVALLGALSVLAAVAALASSSINGTRIGGQTATTSVQSREEILATTTRALADFLPLGSGLGSFVKVYRLYESSAAVTPEYVIHAHNDYVELALELGVAGILLMLLFLAWWVSAVGRVWRTSETKPFARAAAIASAAVLVHSLVDFPLRTAAISVCFAMFLALLVDRRAPQVQDAGDLRPARHLVIG